MVKYFCDTCGKETYYNGECNDCLSERHKRELAFQSPIEQEIFKNIQNARFECMINIKKRKLDNE